MSEKTKWQGQTGPWATQTRNTPQNLPRSTPAPCLQEPKRLHVRTSCENLLAFAFSSKLPDIHTYYFEEQSSAFKSAQLQVVNILVVEKLNAFNS